MSSYEKRSIKTIFYGWRYLWLRPFFAALNLLLLSLGLASITILLLVGHQLNQAFDRDLAGIDVVVGARGSPMQLILSGAFHLDVPPGNVPLKAVNALEQHPLVASVIPISLGDNFRVKAVRLELDDSDSHAPPPLIHRDGGCAVDPFSYCQSSRHA